MTQQLWYRIFISILGFKFVAVSCYLLFSGGFIIFGEKKSQAQNKAASKEANKKIELGGFEPPDLDPSIRQRFEQLLNIEKLSPDKASRDEIGKYLNLITKAKRDVEDSLKVLSSKKRELEAIEQTIDTKIEKIEEERLYFGQTVQQEKKIQEDRLIKLEKLYAKMEPKKAAPIFAEMDKDLVVALFGKLADKQITRILENMPADKSKEITEYYGRVGSGSEYDILKEMNQSLKEAFNACRQEP